MFDLSPSDSPVTRNRTPRRKSQAAPVITAYGEHDGVGMGLLSTGEAWLSQRGLAKLCGVQNAHIGTISRDWNTAKPRILAIKARLGFNRQGAHRALSFQGRRLYCYDVAVSRAILDYYAEGAGDKIQPEARANRDRLNDGSNGGLHAFVAGHFAGTPEATPPLRFVPVEGVDEPADAATAFLVHLWGMYVLSYWLAVNYLGTLRERAVRASWNRLGLYLPLKAILEIQADVLHSNINLFGR